MTAQALPFTQFEQFLAIALLLAVVTTLFVAPVVVILYRRRVERLMSAGADQRTSPEPPCAPPPSAPPVPARLLTAAELAAAGQHRGEAAAAARSRLRRIALAYAGGGIAHALVLTLAYALKYGALVSSTVGVILFAVFSLPMVATTLHIVAESRRRQAALFAGLLIGLYLLSGDARSLVETMLIGIVLIPALIFVVFNLRYWRGIAPLAFVLCACGGVGWITAFQLLRNWTVPAVGELWLARGLGAAAGVCLGCLALRQLASLYRRRRFSDQELFIDVWWLVYTLIQTVILVLTTGANFAAVLLAFPSFLAVKRLLLWALVRRDDRSRAPRLLVLRVFGHDRRSEAFFDRLTRTWRCFGPVMLIAGTDLALRTIGPVDVVAFLSGRLARHYVADDSDRRSAVASLDDRPDPDGRFRTKAFFCRAQTWRPVFQDLAEQCDAVVMDLRGFAGRHLGARYELQELSRRHRTKPVLLLFDETTERAALAELIAIDSGGAAQSAQTWALLQVGGKSGIAAGSVIQAVLATLPPPTGSPGER